MNPAQEWDLRVELAACCRLFDDFGWSEAIASQITLRAPGPQLRVLIKPYGLHDREATASNLLNVDLDGRAADGTLQPMDPDGFALHRALHAAVPQARCIMHVHTTAGMAVASSRRGLAPTNRYAASLHGAFAYHEAGERARPADDLGDKRILILRNRGLLVHGPSLPEAFLVLYRLQRACESQVATSAIDDGDAIGPEILAHSRDATLEPGLPGRVPALARRTFDAMIRRIERGDASYAH
jgi:ribulose-5-phosphate 4-epimerase/fuculose-1-phosphate aldolase